MKNKLCLTFVAAVVLVVLGTTGTTGALWHGEVSISPGTVTTGNLELLANGKPESYFTELSAANLAPGDSVSAPLTITNSGSTDLAYQLESLSTGPGDANAPATADADLAKALTLLVTTDGTCDGTAPEGGAKMLYEGPLVSAAFAGSELAPSSSVELCITVALLEDAPVTASAGAISATFIFRGDQVQ